MSMDRAASDVSVIGPDRVVTILRSRKLGIRCRTQPSSDQDSDHSGMDESSDDLPELLGY